MDSTEERPLPLRLRELRMRAGKTGQQLAAELGWVQPKISKIENGKQLPTDEDIDEWARACGVSEKTTRRLHEMLAETREQYREWRQQVRYGQIAIQQDYDKLGREASTIRNVELLVVPGLLQTPGYAREQLMQGVRQHGANPDEVDAAVAARMRRQEILHDESKRFEFLITEAALRLGWCSAAAMLTQLERLALATMGPPHIWFGIIPFGPDLPVVPQSRFIIFDDRVIFEDERGERTYRDNEKVEEYGQVMDELKAEAVTDERARQLIAQAMEEFRRYI